VKSTAISEIIVGSSILRRAYVIPSNPGALLDFFCRNARRTSEDVMADHFI
jgi:hypothetical protein